MPVDYRIISKYKVAYIHARGEVTAEMIMTEGAKMFAEKDWKNGYNILCDYREVTKFDLTNEDVENIAKQDKENKPVFDESKCAVVAKSKLVFGLSRMWELVSDNTGLTSSVFKDIESAIKWLELDPEFLSCLQRMASTS